MRWLLVGILLAGGPPASAEEAGAKAMFHNPFFDALAISSKAEEPKPPEKKVARQTKGRSAPPVQAEARPQPSPRPEPVRSIGSRTWIRRVDDRGKVLAELSADHVFRSGERIQLVMESNAEAYLAVVQQGSDGRVGLLFPQREEELGRHRIPAHEKVVLPGPRHSFTFDDHAGTERLLIVLVRDRLELLSLPLRREMSPKDFEALRAIAAREIGAKNLVTQAFEDSEQDPATYAVNRVGGAVVQEISLVHKK